MSTTILAVNKQRVEDILHRYGVTEVSVFGSFSRGDASPGSDLDLLVTYKPGTSLFDVLALQDELEDVFGRKVDLISRKFLSTRLAKRIESELQPLTSIL
jgi:predicted nucleotidyltransferase